MSSQLLPNDRRVAFVERVQFYNVGVALIACGYILLYKKQLESMASSEDMAHLGLLFLVYGTAAVSGIIAITTETWRYACSGRWETFFARVVRATSALADAAIVAALIWSVVEGYLFLCSRGN